MIVAEGGKKRFIPSQHNSKELEDFLALMAGSVEKTAERWARAKADYEALRLFKDVVLSKAMPTDGAEHERKRVAHTSEPYVKHMEALADAYSLMTEAEAHYVSAQTKYEAVKSIFLKRFGSSG